MARLTAEELSALRILVEEWLLENSNLIEALPTQLDEKFAGTVNDGANGEE
jgi:hypothetical protein